MRRFASRRGEITLGNILTLLIAAFVIYELFQFGPVLFAQYEFRDAVIEEAKFSRGKNERVIKDSLTKKAAELGLPIAADNIKVELQNTRTRIEVNYKLRVEWLPNKEYTWDVREVAESAIF